MEIRKLTIADTPLWKHNRLEALINHPENYLSSYEEEINLSDLEWQNRISEHAVFGVFENQNLLSMVSFSMLPRIKSKHIGEIWGF